MEDTSTRTTAEAWGEEGTIRATVIARGTSFFKAWGSKAVVALNRAALLASRRGRRLSRDTCKRISQKIPAIIACLIGGLRATILTS